MSVNVVVRADLTWVLLFAWLTQTLPSGADYTFADLFRWKNESGMYSKATLDWSNQKPSRPNGSDHAFANGRDSRHPRGTGAGLWEGWSSRLGSGKEKPSSVC